MRRDPLTLRGDMSLREAAEALERASRTGAPVVGPGGELVGFLSLRDIMKGRQAAHMQAPVKAYMTRNVLTASSQGAPAYDLKVLVGEIYANGFVYYHMGYAGAQCVVLLLFVMSLLVVQFLAFREK